MLQAAFGSHGLLSLSGLTRSTKLSYILKVWRAGFEPAPLLVIMVRRIFVVSSRTFSRTDVERSTVELPPQTIAGAGIRTRNCAATNRATPPVTHRIDPCRPFTTFLNVSSGSGLTPSHGVSRVRSTSLSYTRKKSGMDESREFYSECRRTAFLISSFRTVVRLSSLAFSVAASAISSACCSSSDISSIDAFSEIRLLDWF